MIYPESMFNGLIVPTQGTTKAFKKGGILLATVIAIILALICGQFFPVSLMCVFVVLNAIFGQFLGFYIPLITIGLATPAIADLRSGFAKRLGLTALIAYISTLYFGFLTYGIAVLILLKSLHQGVLAEIQDPLKSDLVPFFTITMDAIISVMGALILSFIIDIGLSLVSCEVLRRGFVEFRKIIIRLTERVIISLLPLHIFGIFLNMTKSGAVMKITAALLTVVVLVLVLEVVILVTQYLVGGLIYGINSFKTLLTALPAHMTALGTSSSAASIPVTLKQAKELGVPDAVASLTVSPCVTIHLAGSTSKIIAFALAIMITSGIPLNLIHFTDFTFMLGITMVAAPGAPGDAAMAATRILSSMLGFNETQTGLTIASYIALDSSGTAISVTGDGATSLSVARLSDGKFLERDQRIAASFTPEDIFDAQKYLEDVKQIINPKTR